MDIKTELNGNRDFILGESDDLVLVTGAAEFASAVSDTIRTARGEWWLDTGHGIDHDLLRDKSTPDRIKYVHVQTVLRGVPGFGRLVSFSSSIDPLTRVMVVRATVQHESGEEVTVDEVV